MQTLNIPFNSKRIISSAIAALFTLSMLLMLVQPSSVSAAQLTSRSLTLGSSAPDASTTHEFDFTMVTSDDVGSVIFEYCTSASGSCTPPTDLDVDSVTLSNQTGATGFAIDATATTANEIVIDRTPASVTGPQAVSYTFSSAVNPSATNDTFFVRVSTTDAVDGGGSTIDTGVVAASTATQIDFTASVDETLVFCTGTSGITTSDCSGATGSSVGFGTLSSSTASTGTSQIGVGTNAANGFAITVNGATLTCGGCAGTPTIDANTSPTAYATNDEQFGMNLVDNATPNVGTDPQGSGDSTPTADYGTADSFTFNTGDAIVDDSGDAESFRLFTASYIAAIATDTEAGAYTATFTYIATATF